MTYTCTYLRRITGIVLQTYDATCFSEAFAGLRIPCAVPRQYWHNSP